ncbi:MAG: hypothetical protein ACPGQL_01030 [Thermoplasmatota archaeon]
MAPPGFRPTTLVIHPDVDSAYAALEVAASAGTKPQQAIWKRLLAARTRIQADGQWGEVIPRDDIPAYFVDRYDVTNLYCIDLKGDVRCFYTIDGRDIVFLDLVDHDQYDLWFPPKGRKKRR